MSKTSYVAALVIPVWGIIAWKLGDSLATNAMMLAAGVAVTLFAGWYIHGSQKFAERNPAQALLDGAEFLEWSRLEAAAKGVPTLPAGQEQVELLPDTGTGDAVG